MTSPRRLLVAVVAGLSLTLAAVALAAPARKGEVSAASPKFTWEGTGSGVLAIQNAGDGVGCQPGIHDCDETLIHVTEAGTLTVKTSSDDPAAVDSDLQLLASDESGKDGKELKESAAADPTPSEQVSAEVDPGYYIARIDFMISAQGTVKGEATFVPGAPLEPGGPVSGGGTPLANRAPTTTAKKPAGKKITSFSGTAKDTDGSVASVAIGVLQLGKNGKCKQLTASGKFATVSGKCTQPSVFLKATGGATWSFKLKKKLAKGSYVLFARATDDKGLAESGFGPANKKAFKVK